MLAREISEERMLTLVQYCMPFDNPQASIAALPRLHPGLLVARAQAADLAGRLQAHAQVCKRKAAWHACAASSLHQPTFADVPVHL